jgi:signal transduction histidine kinase
MLNRIFKGGLNTKLVRVFISRSWRSAWPRILGVYAAALVVERVLVQEALNGEAEHFWSYRTTAASHCPTPTTCADSWPARAIIRACRSGCAIFRTGLSPGRRGTGFATGVHVSDRGADRLYLVFDEVQVSSLAFYFGIAPLTAVLLLIYILTWAGYLMSRRAVSTVVSWPRRCAITTSIPVKFEKFSPEDPSAIPADSEVVTLVNAFNQFIDRLESFIQRERNFTRNASHELRTPLAVVKANLELLATIR